MLLKNMTVIELAAEIVSLQNAARALRGISREYVRQAVYAEEEVTEAKEIMTEKKRGKAMTPASMKGGGFGLAKKNGTH